MVRLEDGGPVIGMLPSTLVNYSQGEIDLRSGDMIVGFTDGISEAMNLNEEEWGEDSMLEYLKRSMTDALPRSSRRPYQRPMISPTVQNSTTT